MKIPCIKHGCHFPEEFEEAWRCPFWKSFGLGRLPKVQKRKLWDWLFQLPCDEIYLQSGYMIGVQVSGRKSKTVENEWAENDPKYVKMSEKQKRAHQKRILKKLFRKQEHERHSKSKIRGARV